MTVTQQPPVGAPGGGQDPHNQVPQRSHLTTSEFLWEFIWGLILVGLLGNLLRLAGSSNRVLARKKLFANLAGSAVTGVVVAVFVGAVILTSSDDISPALSPSYHATLDPSGGPVMVQGGPSVTPAPVHGQVTVKDHNGLTPNPMGDQDIDDTPSRILGNREAIRLLALSSSESSYLDHVYTVDAVQARSGDESAIEDGITSNRYRYDQIHVIRRDSDHLVLRYHAVTEDGTDLYAESAFVYTNGEWLMATMKFVPAF